MPNYLSQMVVSFDAFHFANQVNALLSAIPDGHLIDIKYTTLSTPANPIVFTAMVISK